MGGGNATLNLTEMGAHTLDAWMREDGLRVDRMLLVTDTTYIPSGLGPAESTFQTITETMPGGLGTTSIAYQYDALHRLTGATYSGAIVASFEYVYDAVGNMTAYTDTVDGQTTSVSRSFDAANRLQVSMDATAGTTGYIYDDNGNLTTVYPPASDAQNPVGVLRYDYDQRNLMVSHETNPDGTAWVVQAAYVYDGNDGRLQQVDYTGLTPITTTYTNDSFGLTQVLVADDGITQVYNLFGLDLILQDSGSEVRALLTDGLGSVRLEMEGNVVETATTYSPYGEVLAQTGTSGTAYGFTGEQEDETTGLLYLRARYYSPQLKVFQSRDPWEGTGWRPGTLNYYQYASGNPVKFADPTGHCPRPSKDSGRVICVDLFIADETIIFGTGFGDGRGFSSDSDPTKSRGYVYIYLDEKDSECNVATQMFLNDSETIFRTFEANYAQSNFNVTTDLDNGEIKVVYTLRNGFTAEAYENSKRAEESYLECNRTLGHGKCGAFLPFEGPLARAAIPDINGTIILNPNLFGGYDVFVDRDPYPWLEIYQYQDGELVATLAQLTPANIGESPLGPVGGLNPLAPNQVLTIRNQPWWARGSVGH